MDFLKRSLAPVTDAAWEQLEVAVTRVLKAHLAGRQIVEVDGPHGVDRAAVPIGRLEIHQAAGEGDDGIGWGIHRLQPLLEVRLPFALDIWELDNASRGALDLKVEPAEAAARAIAAFEDRAILHGFRDGGIVGLADAAAHDPIPLQMNGNGFLESVAQAMMTLHDAGIQGPYSLVLGPDAFRTLVGLSCGYPLRKQIENVIAGRTIYSRTLQGALLVSGRGGDFHLTLGQDLAIGYQAHDTRQVTMFLTESFTFRVLEPAACVHLPLPE